MSHQNTEIADFLAVAKLVLFFTLYFLDFHGIGPILDVTLFFSLVKKSKLWCISANFSSLKNKAKRVASLFLSLYATISKKWKAIRSPLFNLEYFVEFTIKQLFLNPLQIAWFQSSNTFYCWDFKHHGKKLHPTIIRWTFLLAFVQYKTVCRFVLERFFLFVRFHKSTAFLANESF